MILSRQKLLLSLIKVFDNHLSNTEFMKYLFLFIQENNDYKKLYSFVPYKYGCFSFEAYQDRNYLISKGYLVDDQEFKINNFDIKIEDTLYLRLLSFKKKYSNIKGRELIKYVYLNYPYYAINSEIKSEVLKKNELEIVDSNHFIDINDNNELYTIGYEGCKIEEYINKLIVLNIKTLVDVRKNAFSMKYDFSKSRLSANLNKMGITYIHIPELGIDSDNRKNLIDIKDYVELFIYYEKNILINKNSELSLIYNLIKKNNKVALTCFEKDFNMCHRSIISKQDIFKDNFLVKHI